MKEQRRRMEEATERFDMINPRSLPPPYAVSTQRISSHSLWLPDWLGERSMPTSSATLQMAASVVDESGSHLRRDAQERSACGESAANSRTSRRWCCARNRCGFHASVHGSKHRLPFLVPSRPYGSTYLGWLSRWKSAHVPTLCSRRMERAIFQ